MNSIHHCLIVGCQIIAGVDMHCASDLDTDIRGVGASKVLAAAQDGVTSSTQEFNATAQSAVRISTPPRLIQEHNYIECSHRRTSII